MALQPAGARNCTLSGRDTLFPFSHKTFYFWLFMSLCSLHTKATFCLKNGLTLEADGGLESMVRVQKLLWTSLEDRWDVPLCPQVLPALEHAVSIPGVLQTLKHPTSIPRVLLPT